MAIPILHCKVLDAVYSGGLIALGPFLVTLSLKGIPKERVRLEEVGDCNTCLIGTERCGKQVRNTVPAELLRLIS